jgi:hypothetical protein
LYEKNEIRRTYRLELRSSIFDVNDYFYNHAEYNFKE